MSQHNIRYKASYKYQLFRSYEVDCGILPAEGVVTDFIELDSEGWLTIKKGYAWDGPSGPVQDTRETMRASLVHDALYQLMRLEELSARKHRKAADRLFRNMCKKDGVSGFWANRFYDALRRFGKPAASPQNKKKIHIAPGWSRS